jgi:hypothetical protein
LSSLIHRNKAVYLKGYVDWATLSPAQNKSKYEIINLSGKSGLTCYRSI